MTTDLIINRLIGQGEQGDRSPAPSPEATRELSQRLRELVSADAGRPGGIDRGAAQEALKLAAYLDGTMDAPEREAYERALVHSAERREDLASAAAWLDEIEARQAPPPADLRALALSLDQARPAEKVRRSGFVAFIERLFPGPRLALATAAIASVAMVSVGLNVALLSDPQLAPQHQIAAGPSTPTAHSPRMIERPWVDSVARNPDDRPMVYTLPQGRQDFRTTPELVDAVLAYRKEPSTAHRQQLLAALARVGLTAEDARRVTTITVNPALYEHFALGASNPVASIMTRLAADGGLTLEVGRMR